MFLHIGKKTKISELLHSCIDIILLNCKSFVVYKKYYTKRNINNEKEKKHLFTKDVI